MISSGFTYDWDTLGGRNFTNETVFFSGSGAQNVYSMQYMSNWEDADGSMTQRNERTVIGPAAAGKWYVISNEKLEIFELEIKNNLKSLLLS